MKNTPSLVDFNSLPKLIQVKVKERIFEEISIEYKNMGIPLKEPDVEDIVMSRVENKLFYTDDNYSFFIIDRLKDII